MRNRVVYFVLASVPLLCIIVGCILFRGGTVSVLDSERVSEFASDMICLWGQADAKANLEKYQELLSDVVYQQQSAIIADRWENINGMFFGQPMADVQVDVSNVYLTSEDGTETWYVEGSLIWPLVESRTYLFIGKLVVNDSLITAWSSEIYDTNPQEFNMWG